MHRTEQKRFTEDFVMWLKEQSDRSDEVGSFSRTNAPKLEPHYNRPAMLTSYKLLLNIQDGKELDALYRTWYEWRAIGLSDFARRLYYLMVNRFLEKPRQSIYLALQPKSLSLRLGFEYSDVGMAILDCVIAGLLDLKSADVVFGNCIKLDKNEPSSGVLIFVPDDAAEEKRGSRPGYIYVFRIAGENKYKIGFSQDIQTRLKQIMNSGPYSVELTTSFFVDDCPGTELVLHDRFREKRIRGEWFELNEDDVAYLKSL